MQMKVFLNKLLQAKQTSNNANIPLKVLLRSSCPSSVTKCSKGIQLGLLFNLLLLVSLWLLQLGSF